MLDEMLDCPVYMSASGRGSKRQPLSASGLLTLHSPLSLQRPRSVLGLAIPMSGG